jgi:hypothetical protein
MDLQTPLGRWTEAQAESRPHQPKLYSLPGFDYAQLLLERAASPPERRAVLKRGRYSLEIVQRLKHLLSQALDHCTIGQALSALGEPGAEAALDWAVSTMQRAGSIDDQPKVLRARAHHLCRMARTSTQVDPQALRQAAWIDQAKALAIARRVEMRTYLAECALLAGNLHLDAGQVPRAAAEHAEAARLIREDGYGRREAELHLLQARLLHQQHDPAGARTALAAAEARIRAVGQWGLWPELHRVGEGLGVPVPSNCPPEAFTDAPDAR